MPEPSYSTETPLYQIYISALPKYYSTVNYEIIYPVTPATTIYINHGSSLPNKIKNIYPKDILPFWISITNTHDHYHRGCKFNCQWLKTGITFEVLLNRQYKICMLGSSHIILQNRWFIQKLSTPTPTIYVSPTNTLIPKSIIPTKLDGTTYRPQHHCH